MADTYFVNSTGLPPKGITPPRADVARMTVEMLKHPLYFEYSTIWLDSVIHESGRETQLTNTNRAHPPVRWLRRRQNRLHQRSGLLHFRYG